MRCTLQSLLAGGMLILVPAALPAQDLPDDDIERPPSHFAINLTVGGTGISIGNSARVNGLRLNWSDYGLRRVNGINLTLWKPHERLSGTITGAAIGVVGPGADEINGLAFGLGGVVTERRMRGIAIAGLGVVSQGNISGLALAGLGTVSQGDLSGIAVAGLGTVSQGDLSGIALAGLGTVAQGDVTGFAFAGLGTVAQGHITGIALSGLGTVAQGDLTGAAASLGGVVAQGDLRWVSVAGLATVAQGDITGFTVSGLATVAQGHIEGISVNGLALVAQRGFSGIGVGGVAVVSEGLIKGAVASLYRVDAPRVSGFSLAGYLKTQTFTGIGVGVYNRVRTEQRGLMIGLVNYARRLKGFQVGVINFARNNRWPFKVLPILNAHL